MVNKSKYKVGIIGCGRMGWSFNEDKLVDRPVSHLAGYINHPRTEVVAVCDLDPKKVNKISSRLGIKNAYTDHKKMLAEHDLDIVSICTPTQTHAKLCVDASRFGVKVIFCEKPIAVSLGEAQRMINACKKHKVRLVINHTRRWDKSYQSVKTLLDKKVIGDIDLVTAFSTVGLLNGGTHLFDLLRMYLGDATSVAGRIIPDPSSDPGARGMIHFKGGNSCFFDSSFRKYLNFGTSFYGQKGIIHVKGLVRGTQIEVLRTKKSGKESNVNELILNKHKAPKGRSAIVNAIDNIVNSIEKKEKIQCNGEDGKAALEIAIAFHCSDQKDGRKVAFPCTNKSMRVIPRMTSFSKDGKLNG